MAFVGAESLAEKPSAQVIVTDCPEAYSAAQRLFTSLAVIFNSSSGAIDWAPLAGRQVVLMPSSDRVAEARAMAGVLAPIAETVKLCAPEPERASGWSIASEEEWDSESAFKWARAVAKPMKPCAAPHAEPALEPHEDDPAADDAASPGDRLPSSAVRGIAQLDASAAARKGNGANLILSLARLPAVEYDRRREDEAKALGIRVSTLDDEVRKKRIELAIENPDETGGGIFPSRDPWGEKVNGAELLEELAATFRRFVVLPKHADTALALWVVITYLAGDIGVAPMLAIRSPEKRCGKTSLIGLLSRLAHKAMPASNISPSAIFRSIEKWSPTLMIDEADSFLGENEELRGILNSGHTKDTAFVIRAVPVGDGFEPQRFVTFGLKAIALIGALPDTLADRSVAIELRRKMPAERVQKLRHAGDLEPLARRCLRWATDNAEKVRAARPAIPEELDDRAGDNWEPLLAVADLAGGAWPKAARAAASVLSGATADGDSTKVELLKNLLALFRSKFAGRDAFGSGELVEALTEDKSGRWYEFSHGKPLTQRQLARLLRPFGIVSGAHRDGGQVFKGYALEAFDDAFRRYIPGFDPLHGYNAQSTRVVTDKRSVTEGDLLRIEDPLQASNGAGCNRVTDRKALSDGGERF